MEINREDGWERARARPLSDDVDPFATDRSRILATSAFRRLAGKTQVFILPSGDHYRTRMTHTLDVADIARAVARGLGLDEDLTEAIALGHDLGHTPFGHAGEAGLDEFCQEYQGRRFRHREHSLRVVEVLAGGGGLNLTGAVRDGILHHSGDTLPRTREGEVVRISDRIAYLTHDVDDAVHAGIIHANDIPQGLLDVLGDTPVARRALLIADLIATSADGGAVRFSPPVADAFLALRAFMFERVYHAGVCAAEAARAARVVRTLAEYYHEHPDALPPGSECVDYIAGMTDRFAVRTYQALFLPAQS